MSIFGTEIQNASSDHLWEVSFEDLFQSLCLVLFLLLFVEGVEAVDLGDLQGHFFAGAQQVADFFVSGVLAEPLYEELYELAVVALGGEISLMRLLAVAFLLLAPISIAPMVSSTHIELLQSRINNDLAAVFGLLPRIHIVLQVLPID